MFNILFRFDNYRNLNYHQAIKTFIQHGFTYNEIRGFLYNAKKNGIAYYPVYGKSTFCITYSRYY